MTATQIAAKFDAALETAQLDADSLVWESRTTFRVKVSGQWVRGRLAVASVDGLRAALADVLRDYCAGRAAGVL